MKLILASNSPRRKQLLAQAGFTFDTIPSQADEHSTFSHPCDIAKELATCKALDVYKHNHGCVVIGCDTVVDVDGKVFGKPKDADEATQMLTVLSDRSHFVHTGVCIVWDNGIVVDSQTTTVVFNKLSASQIASYVNGGSPMDKAGAYGIQDSGFVREIVGEYDNVVGFPTSKIVCVLDKITKGEI